MRGDTNTRTAKRTRDRAAVPARPRPVLIALAALILTLALFAAPASAGLYHPKSAACSFGPDGTSSSSFEGFPAIAFQQQASRLYVAGSETAPVGLYGFDASVLCPSTYPPLSSFAPLLTPKLLLTSQIAIDNTPFPSMGNVYALGGEGKQILGYDSAGNELPGFPIASISEADGKNHAWTAVAVDPGGDLWAADFQGTIYEYGPTGAPLKALDLSGGSVGLAGVVNVSLDFDASADIYVAAGGDGIWKLSAPAYDTPVEINPKAARGITVDRASGDLYVATESLIERYGPGGALIEGFPSSPPSGKFTSIAVDEASKAVYVVEGSSGERKVAVFEAMVLPDLTNEALNDLSATAATLNGSVDSDGLALSDCKFEYVSEAVFLATGFTDLSSGGEVGCTPAFSSIPTSGVTSVSAVIAGLSPGARYRFRLSASNLNGTNSSKPVSFALAQPGVETVGSPIRTATAARLDSRVDPHGIFTTYHFEYVADATYEANLAASESLFAGATSTADHSAGSGGVIELASEKVEGLTPATTYHYRVLADNGAFGGPAIGEERILTTRASDTPLSHGHFPGPPGSDRAWEQVSLPDSSGNPVSGAAGISSGGEAAAYQVSGGTPGSEAGTLYNYLFARRPPGEHPESGWQTESVYPSRKDATFSAWRPPTGDDSLSTLLALNIDTTSGSGAGVWRIPTEDGAPAKLYEAPPKTYGGLYIFSDDGSRALLLLEGDSIDKDHKSPGGATQLYDVSSGEPHMVSLLPGAGPAALGPSCGTSATVSAFQLPGTNFAARSTHWLSADGSRAFFATAGSGACGAPHLYVRDLDAADSFRVDGPPLSGPDCSGALIRSTPEAAFFWTQSRLAPEDTAIAGGCDSSPSGFTPRGDVYRYDLTDHVLQCLTCVAPGGLAANVAVSSGAEGAALSIAVSPAGPRLYFTTRTHLLPGAAEAGTPAIYRVDTSTHQLAYVAPLEPGDSVGENPQGEYGPSAAAISFDGRFLAFRSASPGLDTLTGSANANSAQFYLYDDAERSLSCVSCPLAAVPRAATAKGIIGQTEAAPNMTSLSENGVFAYATPTPLVNADQNTAPAGGDPEAGYDVYEWRDGRPLLVSDGLTNWPSAAAPQVAAISPSGRDLFFTAAAQLTPDALDGYARLYDARIGGGIEFSEVPKPCALEVCQGTPKGAPEEAPPGTGSFRGSGNVQEGTAKPRCPKGKARRNGKGRCVAKKHHKRAHKQASHGRRAAR